VDECYYSLQQAEFKAGKIWFRFKFGSSEVSSHFLQMTQKKSPQALNCQSYTKTLHESVCYAKYLGIKQIFINFAFSAELNWIILQVGY